MFYIKGELRTLESKLTSNFLEVNFDRETGFARVRLLFIYLVYVLFNTISNVFSRIVAAYFFLTLRG